MRKKNWGRWMKFAGFRIFLIFVASVGMAVILGDAIGLFSSAGLLRWLSVVAIVFTICMHGLPICQARASDADDSLGASACTLGDSNEHAGVRMARLARMQRSPWTRQAALALTLFAAIVWARGSYVLALVPDWIVLLTWSLCIAGPVGLWWTSSPKFGRPSRT